MTPYFYKFLVNRVVDGDTVDGYIDLGFKIGWNTRIRFSNIDAPETWRPVNEAEYDAGKKCTEFVTNMLDQYPNRVYVQSNSLDLYGRCIGTLFLKKSDGTYDNLTTLLDEYMTANGFTKEIVRK